MKNNIKENLVRIWQKIEEAKKRGGRHHENIKLVAVSKMVPLDALSIAYECGQKNFGESYVQEALKKIEASNNKDISWHFIGRLQKNKIKYLPEKFTLIHSVNNFEIVEEINKRFKERKSTANILVQLNLAKEKTKAGISEENIFSLVEAILPLENVRMHGLMTMPPYSEDSELTRPYFRRCREILIELQKNFKDKIGNDLSMGMSHDYLVAIEEGATIIRIGTAIFGERTTQ